LYIRFAVRQSDALQRSALLERLILRAGRPVQTAEWRSEAFRVLDPTPATMPPIAPTAWHAAAASRMAAPRAPPDAPARCEPDGAAAWVCVATPVHLSAGMSSVRMPPGGILTLDAAEVDMLAADFNRVFEGAGVRLWVGCCGTLLCVFDAVLEIDSTDPEVVAGHDVFHYQPIGVDAVRVRRTMSEIEMWLFEHALNRARAAQARPAVTGLWLWGGGATVAARPATNGWTAGHDPFFSSFGNQTQWPQHPGAGVIVTDAQPGTAQWNDTERRWLAPAVERLRQHQLSRIDLSAGTRRFSVGPGAGLRFWRRLRPWWESFGVDGNAPEGGDE
jgi:hypothetical protein